MAIDKEKAKKNLKEISDKIHSNSDISKLQEYQRLYKKEISFFKRSWAAAWLFMYYDQKETPNERGSDKPIEIILTEEESKWLFISVGKNRKLFPRDIITLIMSKTSTAREDIGTIRILDNYSFVQVKDLKADEIIQVLTGHKFRGRTLSVNYAKPKANEDTE